MAHIENTGNGGLVAALIGDGEGGGGRAAGEGDTAIAIVIRGGAVAAHRGIATRDGEPDGDIWNRVAGGDVKELSGDGRGVSCGQDGLRGGESQRVGIGHHHLHTKGVGGLRVGVIRRGGGDDARQRAAIKGDVAVAIGIRGDRDGLRTRCKDAITGGDLVGN